MLFARAIGSTFGNGRVVKQLRDLRLEFREQVLWRLWRL